MSGINCVNVVITPISVSSAREMHEYMMEAADLVLETYDYDRKRQCLPATEINTQEIHELLMETAEIIFKIDAETPEQKSKKNYSNEVEFQFFANRRLNEIKAANGGQLIKRHRNMRRNLKGSSQNTLGDLEYIEKNNIAAQKSRDRKTVNDLMKKIRLEYLESRNVQLKSELGRYTSKLCDGH